VSRVAGSPMGRPIPTFMKETSERKGRQRRLPPLRHLIEVGRSRSAAYFRGNVSSK
jgi:hypothetical protein